MKRARIPFATSIIIVMILSTYFGVVAAVPIPSMIGPPLVLYSREVNGGLVPSATNVFEAGEEILVGIPVGSSSPYMLSSRSASGLALPQNSSLSANGLIPLVLSPPSYSEPLRLHSWADLLIPLH